MKSLHVLAIFFVLNSVVGESSPPKDASGGTPGPPSKPKDVKEVIKTIIEQYDKLDCESVLKTVPLDSSEKPDWERNTTITLCNIIRYEIMPLNARTSPKPPEGSSTVTVASSPSTETSASFTITSSSTSTTTVASSPSTETTASSTITSSSTPTITVPSPPSTETTISSARTLSPTSPTPVPSPSRTETTTLHTTLPTSTKSTTTSISTVPVVSTTNLTTEVIMESTTETTAEGASHSTINTTIAPSVVSTSTSAPKVTTTTVAPAPAPYAHTDQMSTSSLLLAAFGCFLLGIAVAVVAKLLHSKYKKKSYVLPPDQDQHMP